jgi:hypothetical protein
MNIIKVFLILKILVLSQFAVGQMPTYTINLAPFSSEMYDEFSPAYFKKGIVFCSNRPTNSLFQYLDSQNRAFYKIFYVDTSSKVIWPKAKLFSKDLTSRLNDGPMTFDKNFDTIYFTRNLIVDGKITELSTTRNKIGVFSSVMVDGKWNKVRDLKFNNEWYNIITPFLSSDGHRLYFASDKPGGYGGYDLYYCQWNNDFWDNPVNLGPVINTKGNESYPFVNSADELFFSSDGHPGMGGKDIFFSEFDGKEWKVPVSLDPPINSVHDDFGLITDSTMNKGFFSSKRGGSTDIYEFKTLYPQIFYSEYQKNSQYCYRFYDDRTFGTDTLNFYFEWDFGDGYRVAGTEAQHCFKGPGIYQIRQNILERKTGKIFFTKLITDLNIKVIEQPFISSPDIETTNRTINFNALSSTIPGNKIVYCYWDFGDGNKANGITVSHSYASQGQYLVKMGLTLKNLITGLIHKDGASKKLTILNDSLEIASKRETMNSKNVNFLDVTSLDQDVLHVRYSAEDEIRKGAVFQVEILSSGSKTDLSSNIFKNIRSKSYIKEIKDSVNNKFSYIIDTEANLIDTYLVYKNALALGFSNARVRTIFLKDPAERDLFNLRMVYGDCTDNLFLPDKAGISMNAYPLLDQITGIMNKYPETELEIGIHSDNSSSSADDDLKLSQKRAEAMASYLIGRGTASKRLIPKGYGRSKPLTPNISEIHKKQNRRVEFVLFNN